MMLLAFGEVLWDVYPDGAYLGGAPLNFAAHTAQQGVDVCMLSAVGQDARGDEALSRMREWGVRTEAVARLATYETGVCDVTLDASGVPSYSLRADVAWDHIPCENAPSADVLYFGTLALRSEANKAALARLLDERDFREVLADVNLRAPFYTADTVRFACEHATILKISDEELPTVCALLDIPLSEDLQAVATAFCTRFSQLRAVVITCGGEGACAYDAPTQTFERVAAVPTTVVSTVGAGDSFAAAFTAARLRGETLRACLTNAVELAAFVVAHADAVPMKG